MKAFLLYTRAHTLTDLDAPALVMYGVTMINLGRCEQAVGIITEGLQKDPSNLDGYKNRATALERLGYLSQAACDLETAFSISPNDVDTRSRQGAISRDLHQPQTAISYYERLFALILIQLRLITTWVRVTQIWDLMTRRLSASIKPYP